MIEISDIEDLEAERERQLKEWIEGGKEREFRIMLKKADFREFDLPGANFNKAILMDCNFHMTGLIGADFREAYFENCDLTFAYFNGADLRGAKLPHIDLSEAHFKGADLRSANLEWAVFIGTDLCGADLRGANFRRHQIGAATIKSTIITKDQYDKLARLYSSEFMAGFLVKGLYD